MMLTSYLTNSNNRAAGFHSDYFQSSPDFKRITNADAQSTIKSKTQK